MSIVKLLAKAPPCHRWFYHTAGRASLLGYLSFTLIGFDTLASHKHLPSYTEIPFISPDNPASPSPEIYVFKLVSPLITELVPKCGGTALYHIVKELVPLIDITNIVIRRGPSSDPGEVVAAVPVGASHKKKCSPLERSAQFIDNAIKLNKYQGIKWHRVPEDHCWLIYLAALKGRREILCTPSSRAEAPSSPVEARKVYARYRLPETVRELIQSSETRSEPELEISDCGVQNIDAYLTSLVLMFTERPEWFTIWTKQLWSTGMQS
ncbi:hypothetical protein DL96DRAFT_1706386 [Flagelloscypha sp. PMI_526]|nr:hypothetical protein DL96DRAFT_1706386 [Flagelloscypha sp. PMI_526]